MLSSAQIRSGFIKFFEDLQHAFVRSSDVVPKEDPTLLFANAGMNQFKDVFLGIGTRPYTRAANTQKCIRVSGKHNDLEEVGVDTYHHTFFEMLGNWSFGDYFKAEAIAWAWQLLTEVWGLPKDRLYATVFAGDADLGLAPDDEAARLWTEVTDLDPSHVQRFGVKDNFWQMADTGPCGPCSELHIDLTPDRSGAELVNRGDARVIEIWNLVFIQFDRREGGKLVGLPARHVDTGMGLERISAVIKHLDELKTGRLRAISNYGTDLFVPIIARIEALTGCRYGATRAGLPDRYDSDDCACVVDIACRVIADHVRALTFAIVDGALPSNEGRGYVLRRLLRRAARYGRKLDVHEPFIYQLVPVVVEAMSGAFPELAGKADFVAQTLLAEEKAFGRTLDRGIDIFEQVAAGLEKSGDRRFPGAEAFRLYDTYGFPLDLTQLMARERGMTVDDAEFSRLMDEQRTRGREAAKGGVELASAAESLDLPETDERAKYDPVPLTARVLGWIAGGTWHPGGSLPAGVTVDLVVDRTCFYGESGGEIGDTGRIEAPGVEFAVEDTQKANHTVLHRGRLVRGTLAAGAEVTLHVDRARRQDIANNHTATHLVHWALRQVLGGHVKQAGSLVSDEYLRFDFTHPQAMKPEEIARAEELVRERIAAACPVTILSMPLAEALKQGITALFGEKYGEQVRVVAIGEAGRTDLADCFSRELCGGAHVRNTVEIRDFKILREESLQTGVRRITAKTGRALSRFLHDRSRMLDRLVQTLKVPADDVPSRVEAILKENRDLKKQLREGDGAVDVGSVVDGLVGQAVRVGSAAAVIGELPNAPVEKVRAQVDRLKKKFPQLVAVFGLRGGEKVQLMVAVSDELIKKGMSANELIKPIAAIVGGGGGGKEHLAQAGGKDPDKLPAALDKARTLIAERLAAL